MFIKTIKVTVIALLLLVLLGTMLIAGGIISNRLPLTQDPGLGTRLKTYLRTHVAETDAQSSFPELRAPTYTVPTSVLYGQLLQAVDTLGWKISEQDPRNKRIHAVISTRLWRFKDDIVIQITPASADTSHLSVRAQSRVGRGDLGANTRHILDLFQALEGINAQPGKPAAPAS